MNNENTFIFDVNFDFAADGIFKRNDPDAGQPAPPIVGYLQLENTGGFLAIEGGGFLALENL